MTELNQRQQLHAVMYSVALLVIALRERTTTVAKPEIVKPQVIQEALALAGILDTHMMVTYQVPK